MASELGELRRGLGGSIRLIISIGDGGDDLEECRKVNPSAPFIGRPVAPTCGLPETATVSAVAWRLPRSPRSTAARQLLRVVDLTQVQHVSLHHAPPGDPRVLAERSNSGVACHPSGEPCSAGTWPPIIGTLAALRIDLVGTTADFRRFDPRQPLPINHLICENREMQGRIGEVRLVFTGNDDIRDT